MELVICTEEQMHKVSIDFYIKTYIHFKNISFDVNIDYFLW